MAEEREEAMPDVETVGGEEGEAPKPPQPTRYRPGAFGRAVPRGFGRPSSTATAHSFNPGEVKETLEQPESRYGWGRSDPTLGTSRKRQWVGDGRRKRSLGGGADDDDDDDDYYSENDEKYRMYKNKRLRVVHDPDIQSINDRETKTFMILTDEVMESAWREPQGTHFTNMIQGGVNGALRPESYIYVSNKRGLENVVEDELWANRNAGNMMNKLCDRIDWLNDQLGQIRQRVARANDDTAARLREEDGRRTREAKEKSDGQEEARKEADRYRDHYRHVRYRSMVNFAFNRGFLDKRDALTEWGGANLMHGRLRAISGLVHGGDLRNDIALADSEYLMSYQGKTQKEFYFTMFKNIYMMEFELARWLVQMAKKYYQVETWINLVDRYIYISDSTLGENFDKVERIPQMDHPRVSDIFKRMDILYRRWVKALEKLMHDSRCGQPDPKVSRPLSRWDFAAAAKAAEDFNRAAERMQMWDRLSRPDEMWDPAARFQRKYDAPWFKQRYKPEG